MAIEKKVKYLASVVIIILYKSDYKNKIVDSIQFNRFLLLSFLLGN